MGEIGTSLPASTNGSGNPNRDVTFFLENNSRFRFPGNISCLKDLVLLDQLYVKTAYLGNILGKEVRLEDGPHLVEAQACPQTSLPGQTDWCKIESDGYFKRIYDDNICQRCDGKGLPFIPEGGMFKYQIEFPKGCSTILYLNKSDHEELNAKAMLKILELKKM